MGGLLDASTPSTEVVAALTADSARYTWVAAAIGSQNAAGLQLATELPVMAIGGFNGSDPSPTLAQFQALVKAGRIHYFAASNGRGGGPRRRRRGGSSAITSWVTAHLPGGDDRRLDVLRPDPADVGGGRGHGDPVMTTPPVLDVVSPSTTSRRRWAPASSGCATTCS